MSTDRPRSSLNRNIVSSYASQLYVTLVGIVLVPLYIKHMGAEAYGLVGFFTMLQSWFALLDMGLTQTISRETARYRGGSLNSLQYRQLFRALSAIFIGVALLGGGGLFQLSNFVALKWLNVERIAQNEVVLAVQIMCLSVALRWLGGLYRGVVTGSEQLIWMSTFNVLIATLRFVLVFWSMFSFGFTPYVFFLHQFVVAVLELLGLFAMAYKLLPRQKDLGGRIGFSFKPIRSLIKFAMTIAFTSSIWVLVTQSDKLVLSGVLPLAEYGYFTLAVLVASGVIVITSPISGAIMPRMARLHAEDKNDELLAVYRRSTRLVSSIAGSAAATVGFFSEELLFAWSGDRELARMSAPVLGLYAIGNGLLAVGAFPYYLQYARGDLRFHLIGNSILVIFLIPSIVFAASSFGGVGAGWVWLGMNLIYLLIWVAYVHEKLVPGLHRPWIANDVLSRLVPSFIVAWLASAIPLDGETRLVSITFVLIVGALSFSLSILIGKFALLAPVKANNND